MIIDIIVGAVLLVSAVIAFLRGFIREVLTIAGVVGGLAAAYSFGSYLSPYIYGWLGAAPEGEEEPQKLFDIIPYDMLADGLAYGAIFIIVMIVLSVVSHFLAETVKSLGMGAIDRSLGVVFGLVRGVLFLGLLYLPLHMLVETETKERWFENSNTHVYLEKTAQGISKFLPKDTLKNIEEDAGQIGETLSTRQKLEDMKLLQKKAQEGDLTEEEQKKLQGYDDEFRQNMDRLFEQKSNTYNE